MLPAHRAPSGLSLLAGALIAAFLLQSFFASRVKSPVFDEPAHIAAGLSYVQTGVFVANLQHPPLLKEMGALSLLLAGVRWPDSPQARQLIHGAAGLEWPIGNVIIADSDADKVMFWSRLPFILLATLLAFLIYAWGRKMVGDLAAIGALFLYALDPTVLAHSFLVTTEVGFAAFTLLFFIAIWSYLRRPNLKRLLLCGVAMGLVLGTKFSAVFLLPVAAFLLVAAVRWPPEPAPGRQSTFLNPYHTGGGGSAESNVNRTEASRSPAKKRKSRPGAAPRAAPHPDQRSRLGRKFAACACAFLAMCLVAMVVIQALYFSPSGLSLYTTGLQRVNADHNPHYLVFMSGQMAQRFPSYFAVAYVLKEPIASIVLVGLGLIAVVRSKTITLLQKLFLLLPPVVLLTAYMIWADNIGIRYIIPALPFAYLAGGVGLAMLIRNGAAWGWCVAAVLCAWIIVAAAGIYPDHLSYFNEMACLLRNPSQIGVDGGASCGPSWLDDSNVDWGQGLKQLRAWMDQRARGRTIRLGYFGSFPPENYGIRHEKIDIPQLLQDPAPGLWVVSAHLVARVPTLAERVTPRGSDWLRRTPPTAIAGHSMYIYDIPQRSADSR